MLKTIDQSFERKVYLPNSEIKQILLIAHGAGAGNQHHFMDSLCSKICKQGTKVISFNFPYMQLVYAEEKKRPPNPNKALLAHFKQEIDNALQENEGNLPLFIAGKSMGGRIASQLAADADYSLLIKGIIAFGYPFIPPGKPEKLAGRIAHFDSIVTPMLICQGERDTFGGVKLLAELSLPKNIELQWLKSGDHGFKPLKSSGLTEQENIFNAAALSVKFMAQQDVI